MGMGKYLILFSFVLSFSFYLLTNGNIQSPMFSLMACFGVTFTDHASTCGVLGVDLISLFKDNILGLLVLGAGAVGLASAIIAGTITFPDPYKLFSLAGLFLIGWVTFPVTLFNAGDTMFNVPEEIKFLLMGYWIIAYGLSYFEFYKGTQL